MILVGVPNASKSVTPCDKQRSDGRPFPLLSCRSLKSARDCGLNGTSTPSAARLFSHRPLGVSQIPDRSGLPSGVLGVAAVRLGWPPAPRGMPGVGYEIHCADAEVDQEHISTTNNL